MLVPRQRVLEGRWVTSGTTVPEVLVALCILAVGFAAVWTAAGQCLQMARAHRETIAATNLLLQRVEDCRASGWNTIVSASAIRDDILYAAATDASSLPNVSEEITVSPYPPVSPAPVPIVVRRKSDGTVQVVSQPSDGLYLRSILAVRADFEVTWTSAQNQRLRRRNASAVISVQALLR